MKITSAYILCAARKKKQLTANRTRKTELGNVRSTVRRKQPDSKAIIDTTKRMENI